MKVLIFQEIFSPQIYRRLKWNSRRNPRDFLEVATLQLVLVPTWFWFPLISYGCLT